MDGCRGHVLWPPPANLWSQLLHDSWAPSHKDLSGGVQLLPAGAGGFLAQTVGGAKETHGQEEEKKHEVCVYTRTCTRMCSSAPRPFQLFNACDIRMGLIWVYMYYTVSVLGIVFQYWELGMVFNHCIYDKDWNFCQAQFYVNAIFVCIIFINFATHKNLPN